VALEPPRHPIGETEMRIQAMPGELVVRFGSRFDSNEVSRVAEAIAVFAPLTALTLDFGAIREFRDAAVAPLAAQVSAVGAKVTLRGLTRHQARVLQYFGHVAADAPAAEGSPGSEPA
jgi:hypothetical protein